MRFFQKDHVENEKTKPKEITNKEKGEAQKSAEGLEKCPNSHKFQGPKGVSGH